MTFVPPECNFLRAALPRWVLLDDLPLLLLSAAALPILEKCAVIPVYRQSPQCGERSNAAFRTQSAVKQTSLAPHDSKARLQDVTNRRRFMAKPCTPHLIPQAAQLFKIETANVGGRGGTPLAFLWGIQRGYSLRKENTPFEGQQRGALHFPPRNARKATAPLRERKKEAALSGCHFFTFRK